MSRRKVRKIFSVLKLESETKITELDNEMTHQRNELVRVNNLHQDASSGLEKVKQACIDELKGKELVIEELNTILENNDEKFMKVTLEKDDLCRENEKLLLETED